MDTLISQKYEYEPLDEGRIRVLVLHPGSGEDEIRCRLVHVSVESPPGYDALSYVWGDATRRRKLICGDGFVEITLNLHTALRYLRHHDQDRIVWADAICINQEDVGERETQVQLMGQVYASAQETVIWLGEETEKVRHAFRLIEKIRSHYPGFIIAEMSNMALYEHQEDILRVTNGFDAEKINSSYDWGPIRELLHRPWFQRKWVIQEVVLSKNPTLQCGHSTLPWRALTHFCVNSKTLNVASTQLVSNQRCSAGFQNVLRIQTSAPTGNNLSCLAVILQTTQNFRCSDPRDHVFALLGLASDREAFRELRPDYMSPAIKTFQRYAICCVREKRNLSFLNLDYEYGADPDAPSWVPDLGKPVSAKGYPRELLWFRATCVCGDEGPEKGFSELPVTLSDREKLLVATARMAEELGQRARNIRENRDTFPVTENLACQAPLQASLSYDERILTLRGILLGEISAASSVFRLFGLTDGFSSGFTKQFKELLIMGACGLLDATTATRFYCHAMADWLKECQAIASDKGEGRLSAARLEQLCRTLLWDFPSPDGRKRLSMDRCVLFAQWMLMVERWASHEGDVAWLARFEAMEDKCSNSMSTVYLGRRFCATANGHLGCVPGAARAGDKICLFYGGSMPYVIRPCGGGQYRFVGDCYLHGFMRGEGMALGVEPEDFALI